MFGFGKRKKDQSPPPAPVAAPAKCPGNPGLDPTGRTAFSNGQRSWVEAFDLVPLLSETLAVGAHATASHGTWLEHRASGFTIQPLIVDVQPLDGGGVRTLTTIQVNHGALAPLGVFEYQHSAGDTIVDSVRKGFDQWAQTDWVTLLDALQPTPSACTVLAMEVPAADGRPPRTRRAILGPVMHLAEQEPAPPADGAEEEHPFCACCLLTRSMEAFAPLLRGDGTACVRMYAARDAEGAPQADCRVNGEDFPAGAEALRAYVATWPDRGFEFRKQYVVMHDG